MKEWSVYFFIFLVILNYSCGKDEVKLNGEIIPGSGLLSGGEPVKIKGSGFRSDMGIEVYFGTQKAPEVIVEGEDTLIATTPPAKKEGLVDIRVRTDDGREFLLRKAFRYVESQAWSITDIAERKKKREKK